MTAKVITVISAVHPQSIPFLLTSFPASALPLAFGANSKTHENKHQIVWLLSRAVARLHQTPAM